MVRNSFGIVVIIIIIIGRVSDICQHYFALELVIDMLNN
jgi:hypothetical protein